MNLSERLKELKKNQTPVKVSYGRTASVEGTVEAFTVGPSGKIHIKTKLGTYGIPIGDIRDIKNV